MPHQAMVLSATAVCAFGDKERWESTKLSHSIAVSGISKYSHINTLGNVLDYDFGSVNVGRSVVKRIILENPSAVTSIINVGLIQIQNTELRSGL